MLGAIFDKLDPILEVTKSWYSPPVVTHCACNQSKLGSTHMKLFPPGTLHLSAGFYCDEALRRMRCSSTTLATAIIQPWSRLLL